MLLQAHNVTVKCEHVVDTLVLETLNIDVLVLFKFDEITNLVLIILKSSCLLILVTNIESVYTKWLSLLQKGSILVSVHGDNIYFAKSVPCLQRH